MGNSRQHLAHSLLPLCPYRKLPGNNVQRRFLLPGLYTPYTERQFRQRLPIRLGHIHKRGVRRCAEKIFQLRYIAEAPSVQMIFLQLLFPHMQKQI